MNISKDNIQEIIKLYLEDTESYGNNEDLMLAENTLNPLKTLILESKGSIKNILTEAYNKASNEDKTIIKDFTLYMNNI